MKDGIIGLAISRPVSTAVGVILVALFGTLSVIDIPIQLTPDVTVPTITVRTRWPGATPLEVEADIIEPQEEALKSLEGLVRMTSASGRDGGSVTLELEVGADLAEALVRLTNLLAQVKDYPDAAREPEVSTADAAGPPLAVVVVQSDPPGRDVAGYYTWMEDEVLPRLDRIPGVAGIRMFGGRDEEIHVRFRPEAMAARGLTLSDLAAAVRARLRDVAAGDVDVGKRRMLVRTTLTPGEPAAFEDSVLAVNEDGSPVRLADFAEVRHGLRERAAIGMVDGAPALAMLFYREVGSNVLEVTEEIHRVVGELQQEYLAPEGLRMRIVNDQVDYIRGALDLVGKDLLIGGALAMLVLLLFLRNVRAAAVVAVSIPVCVMGTALGMSLLGRTVNIVSLAGMAFAVGMVVDNSIVVLENIDTWRLRVADVRLASLRGAKEVWGAIIASTLTTAAVFIPVVGWEDEVGELLRDVALSVSTAVLVSLVVSVLVIPSFAARLLRGRADAGAAPAATRGLRRRIAAQVAWLVRGRLRSLALLLGAVAAAVATGVSLLPSMEYLPTGSRNIVFGVALPPPGYSVDELQAIGDHVQGRMVAHTGVEVDGVAAVDRSFLFGAPEQIFMGAVAEDPTRIGELVTLLRGVQAEIPGAFGFANQASLFGRNLGGGRSIEADIVADDLAAAIGVGQQMMGAIMAALPGAQVRPIPGLDFGAPEFHVVPRYAEAGALGLREDDLGLIVAAYVDGAIVGELGFAGRPKRDVLLGASGPPPRGPGDLAAAPVAVPGGRFVPLGAVARIDESLGPLTIQHIERRRALTLQVAPPTDIPLEDALERVRTGVVGDLRASGAIPRGVRVEFSGDAGQLDGAKRRFLDVLLLAVVISFLLLAALFEDFLAPIVILVTVPLAGAGGVLGLRLVDATLGPQPLDMMTALGFVILVGVVVNNAILVVDGALARMRRGAPLEEAVPEAVRARVRPIFMSALTSLAGLTPLVVFPGSGSELYRGVGAVVLGGLALSTVLTIYVVPAFFATLWRFRRPPAPRPEDAA